MTSFIDSRPVAGTARRGSHRPQDSGLHLPMLSQNVSYNDLGDLYLDKFNKHHLSRNLVRRLERLGYSVTVTLRLQDAAAQRGVIFIAALTNPSNPSQAFRF
jgi:hypothetical protein